MPTEVIATFEGTPIDVAHLSRPRPTHGAWIAAAGFGALAVIGAIAVGAAVAGEHAGREAWTKPAYAYRPPAEPILPELAVVAGSIGAAIAIGIARARRSRSTYWIGAGGDVPVGPDTRFPLVEDERVNVPGSTPIDLPETGTLEVAIGRVKFAVSRIAAAPHVGRPRLDLALAPALGIALFVLLPISYFLPEPQAVTIDLASTEAPIVATANAQHETMPPRAPIGHRRGDDRDDDLPGSGGPMLGAEGVTGMATAAPANGHTRVERTTRDVAIARARQAGVLGDDALRAQIQAMTGTTDWTSGFDRTTAYAPQFGNTGDERGESGFGLAYSGDGGGATDHWGTIGTNHGRYFGSGNEVGTGWGEHGSAGAETFGGGRGHIRTRPPLAEIGTIGSDGLEAVVVRRYLRRRVSQIEYCYEKQLLEHADIHGSLEVAATIRGDGTLLDPSATGFDATVAACVTGVVSDIELPHPTDGVGQFSATIYFQPPK